MTLRIVGAGLPRTGTQRAHFPPPSSAKLASTSRVEVLKRMSSSGSSNFKDLMIASCAIARERRGSLNASPSSRSLRWRRRYTRRYRSWDDAVASQEIRSISSKTRAQNRSSANSRSCLNTFQSGSGKSLDIESPLQPKRRRSAARADTRRLPPSNGPAARVGCSGLLGPSWIVCTKVSQCEKHNIGSERHARKQAPALNG